VTLRDLHETSIQLGMALDIRGEAALQKQLALRRAEYEALPAWQQPFYDQERFRNPFGDVRIVNGPDDVELETILLGINIGLDELLLADRLRSRGAKIDAVIAHHTNDIGVAIALVHDFMPVAIEFLVGEGVPRADAEACINRFIHEKEQSLEDTARMGPDMAKLLGFPLACIHTPADYYIGEGVRPVVEAAQPQTVGDVVRALMDIPEVQSAAHIGAEPRVMSGEATWPAGRMLLKFGGGYGLPPDAYTLLGKAGVNTVVQIGCLPAQRQAAQEAGIAIVRIAHGACDNIGINLLLDEVERRHGPLNVIPCNYFERVKRN
jgi:hypothetical protein